LDLIGDRWTLLVIRDLFRGCCQFRDFARSPERIATNVLADRLERLQEAGLVEKVPVVRGRVREGYRLTDKGRTLGSVLKAVADWGLQNLDGTEAHLKVSLAEHGG